MENCRTARCAALMWLAVDNWQLTTGN